MYEIGLASELTRYMGATISSHIALESHCAAMDVGRARMVVGRSNSRSVSGIILISGVFVL